LPVVFTLGAKARRIRALPYIADPQPPQHVCAFEPTLRRPRSKLHAEWAVAHGKSLAHRPERRFLMRNSIFVLPLAALLLSACVVSPDGRGPGVGVSVGIAVPALPLIVELGSDSYYVHGGYTYFYDNNRWRYAESRSGPWVDLPRSHYPRETRYRERGRSDRRDGDRDRGRGPDRGY
jgi:hypothetical protein